jgi:hypothetical protein
MSLGTGLVGLGSGFLTATRKLREFREVAGLAATVHFSVVWQTKTKVANSSQPRATEKQKGHQSENDFPLSSMPSVWRKRNDHHDRWRRFHTSRFEVPSP